MSGVKKTVSISALILLLASILAVAACQQAAPTPTPTPQPKLQTQPKAATPAPAAATPAAQPKATAPAAPTKPAALQDPPLSPPVKVTVGAIGSPSDAGIYIAMEKGFFKEEGLDIELVPFATGAQMTAPLSTSQLDVGGGILSAGLFNAFNRDIPVKIVADKGSVPKGFGFMGLVLRKDLVDSGAFKTDADIKGKTIANNGTGNMADIQIDKVLDKIGLTRNDVKIEIIPSMPDMLVALNNKAIDAASFIEPNIIRGLENNVIVKWKPSDEIYPDQQIATLMYSPKFAANLPAANRFMVAYVRGLRYYDEAFRAGKNKQEMVSIMNKALKLTDATLFERMTPPGLSSNGYANAKTITDDVKWLTDKGYITQPVDVSKIIDNQYVDYALKRLGKN
ncbi:MAG: ABC transporter substrate-binding protein [Chloroflexi bacterium]|nr:ABC transporter substrate-binding protein [Chloroflexota bacterium]